MFDSLHPHGLQHARLPCPSLSPVCHAHVHPVDDAIQPSHPLLSPFHPAFNLSASGSFPISQPFTSGSQSIGASASASVLPMNINCWFPLGLTGLISLLSKGLSKSLLRYHSSKASILWHSAFFIIQLSHTYMTTKAMEKPELWLYGPLFANRRG